MGRICLFLMYNSSLEEIRLIQERVKPYGVGGAVGVASGWRSRPWCFEGRFFVQS